MFHNVVGVGGVGGHCYVCAFAQRSPRSVDQPTPPTPLTPHPCPVPPISMETIMWDNWRRSTLRESRRNILAAARGLDLLTFHPGPLSLPPPPPPALASLRISGPRLQECRPFPPCSFLSFTLQINRLPLSEAAQLNTFTNYSKLNAKESSH